MIFSFGAHMIVDGGDGLDQWQTNLQKDLIYHQDSGMLSNDIRIMNVEETIMSSSVRGRGSTFYLDVSSGIEVISHNQGDKIFVDVSKKEGGVIASSGLDEAGNAYLLFDRVSILAYQQNHRSADLSFIGTKFTDSFSLSSVKAAKGVHAN